MKKGFGLVMVMFFMTFAFAAIADEATDIAKDDAVVEEAVYESMPVQQQEAAIEEVAGKMGKMTEAGKAAAAKKLERQFATFNATPSKFPMFLL